MNKIDGIIVNGVLYTPVSIVLDSDCDDPLCSKCDLYDICLINPNSNDESLNILSLCCDKSLSGSVFYRRSEYVPID